MNYPGTDAITKEKLYFFRSRATSHLRARIRLQGEGCREVLRLLYPQSFCAQRCHLASTSLGEVEKF